jgi:DNA repair protein RAD5
VQVILESILLRREKTMRDSDGRRIVDLPTKHVTVEKLIFSDAEQRFYEMVYVPAKKKFQQLNAKGLLGKNYTNILAMLMKYVAVFASSLCQLTLIQAASSSATPESRYRSYRR